MIILAILAYGISAIAEAAMDKIQFKFYESVFCHMNHNFWNPEISWQNKWEQGDPKFGPRYWGSSTFLVWTTDGWHLMKWIRNRLQEAGLLFVVLSISPTPYYIIIFWILLLSIFRNVIFEIFFKNI